MEKKELNYNEMVKKFEDAYNNNKSVIIEFTHEFGGSTVVTEELEISENGNKLYLIDANNTSIVIDRTYIRRISLSMVDLSEEIKIDLGDNKIKFILCY